MRTAIIQIGNKQYPICYALQVPMHLEADGIDVTEGLKNPTATFLLRLLHEMMDAGYRWTQHEHPESALEQVPAMDLLATTMDQFELVDLMPVILSVMKGTRNVEAEPTKKAAAGQSAV